MLLLGTRLSESSDTLLGGWETAMEGNPNLGEKWWGSGWSWDSLTPGSLITAGNHTESGKGQQACQDNPGAWDGGILHLRAAVIVEEHGGTFCRSIRLRDSIDKASWIPPHSGSWWEREFFLVHIVYSLFIVENGCIPLPQGEPEIKYLLQEGLSGKGTLLVEPSGSIWILHLFGERLFGEHSVFCATWLVVTFFMWGVHGHVFQAKNLIGSE